MADDDDDYLSDKFLSETSTLTKTKPTTYSQLRKEALKKSQQKNEQSRIKSRRQRETESREEGLSKSLFERAKEEEAAGIENKALSIMMKMGFKPGQSLGNAGAARQDDTEDRVRSRAPQSPPPTNIATTSVRTLDHHDDNDAGDEVPNASPSAQHSDECNTASISHTNHKTEPLPLQEWAGKRGIGLGTKRSRSPTATERVAKMVKMAEDMNHRDFRDRARDEYKNRQAEGRLTPAQLTCTTLDERMGKPFNVLWLNPNNQETFPPDLIDALSIYGNAPLTPEQHTKSIRDRLKQQMQNDALQRFDPEEDDLESLSKKAKVVSAEDQYSPELLEEARQFLRLQAQDRLQLVLSYLRDKYNYCFWCGVEYGSEGEMLDQCPGPEEDDH